MQIKYVALGFDRHSMHHDSYSDKFIRFFVEDNSFPLHNPHGFQFFKKSAVTVDFRPDSITSAIRVFLRVLIIST